jgi:hypothetical protein
MNNPHLALIFIRRFSDFFREPLDQLSIFFRGQRGIVAVMPLDPKQRHKLLMADRTGDAAWITAAFEHLVAADPTVTLDEIEGALRDAAGSAYVIGTADRFEVVIGMPAWLAALAEARVTAAENRAALGDTHPAVLPK